MRKRFRKKLLKILTVTYYIYYSITNFKAVGITINSINLNKQE